MQITAMIFQRQKDGPWERGISINENGLIIDKKGKVVEEIWDGEHLLGTLSLDLEWVHKKETKTGNR